MKIKFSKDLKKGEEVVFKSGEERAFVVKEEGKLGVMSPDGQKCMNVPYAILKGVALFDKDGREALIKAGLMAAPSVDNGAMQSTSNPAPTAPSEPVAEPAPEPAAIQQKKTVAVMGEPHNGFINELISLNKQCGGKIESIQILKITELEIEGTMTFVEFSKFPAFTWSIKAGEFGEFEAGIQKFIRENSEMFSNKAAIKKSLEDEIASLMEEKAAIEKEILSKKSTAAKSAAPKKEEAKATSAAKKPAAEKSAAKELFEEAEEATELEDNIDEEDFASNEEDENPVDSNQWNQ